MTPKPLRRGSLFQPLSVRLAKRVDATDPHGCWPWLGVKNQRGYGMITERIGRYERRTMGAHRASWVVHNGPIPDGQIVLHRCDNPSCCRPDHLFLGTHKDNTADMLAKGRWARTRAPHTRLRKLTDDDVREIRASHAPLWKLAHQFGISEVHACQVRKRNRKQLVADV